MNEHQIKQRIPIRALEALEYLESLDDPSHYNEVVEYIGDLQKDVECVVEDLEESEKERDEQNGYIQELRADIFDAEVKISELEEKINE